MRTLLNAVGRIGIVIAVLVAFFFGLAGTVYLSLRSPEVQVPDLRGQNRYGARQTLEDMGLRMRERSTRYDPEARPDTILDQLPRAGETVKGGQTIFVTISTAQPREGERVSQPTGNANANRETNESPTANDNRNDNRRSNTNNRNANARNSNNRNANNSNANNGNANRNANSNSNRNLNANNRNASGNANNRNSNNRNLDNRNENRNENSRPANNNNGNRNRRPPPTFTTPPFVPGE